MGTAILVVALAVQVAFAAYCIVTRSDHKQVGSWMRIGAFAAFILLTLVSVIEWSFRWYALAALLLIWAALGAWTLLRNRPEKKAYSALRTAIIGLGTLVLVFIVLIPALIFPQYRLPKMTGKHTVATVNYTYTDPNRIETYGKTGGNRQVNVEFWYPKDGDGKYPLVVFSHGSFGVKISNTSTFMELASNGYVVCSIDHPYDSMFTIGSDGRVVMADQSFIQEVIGVNNGTYDEKTKFELKNKWMKLRTADINFVLDTVLAQAKDTNSATVYQHIDASKIGLMGHSLGGASSAQVARQRTDIDAVVSLDVDLFGEYLDYTNGRYVMNNTVYPVPLLTILADDMVRLLDAVPNADAVVALNRVNATAPHAYLVHIVGTDHQSVTDLPLFSPFMVSMITSTVPKAGGGETADKNYVIDTMNALVLQFFNLYLKGEGTFTPAAIY